MCPPRGPSWPAVLALVTAAGCSLTQRPSVKMVDPLLVAEGTALERSRDRSLPRGSFALGPYVVREVEVRSEAPDPDGPLAREAVPRPVTQHRTALVLEAPQTQRAWSTVCTLQRRPPAQTDLRAVLDENGDEVAVGCTAKTAGLPPWRFTTRALLSDNFVGTFGPEGGESPESPESPESWTLEMLTRATHFKRIARVLPVPVAQLRPKLGSPSGPSDGTEKGPKEQSSRHAVVAMLLGRPERAWVAPGVEPITAEAALALMIALSLLPWELAE